MKDCPICVAPLYASPVCRRCGTDWTPVTRVLSESRSHVEAAREAFSNNDAEEMLFHAKRAVSKRRSAETYRLLAVAAILTGNFQLGLRAWRLTEPVSPIASPHCGPRR